MRKLISQEIIEERIFLIRGHKAMIDRDLAQLYGVETKYLNRQVKRNLKRFPSAFMFKLTQSEKNELVTNCHRFMILKHSTSLPFAFTEHGVAMLSSVLNSDRAIKITQFDRSVIPDKRRPPKFQWRTSLIRNPVSLD